MHTKFIFAVAIVSALSAGCQQAKPAPVTETVDGSKYYAVLLTNGAVYYGKMEGLGSPYPVLRDVFYVQPGPVDPNTNQPRGMVLVHRGQELHGPDRMILNERSIVFIEPVGNRSRVAQLIQDAKK